MHWRTANARKRRKELGNTLLQWCSLGRRGLYRNYRRGRPVWVWVRCARCNRETEEGFITKGLCPDCY